MFRAIFRTKGFWIGLIALALVAGGGYAYYAYVYRPGQEAAEPTISTTQVRQGDLRISVSGSGTLVPAQEVTVGFQAGGYLDEVLVSVGDRVQQGDVLARLEMDDLEMAVMEADIKVRLARLDLENAKEGSSAAELADAEAALRSAQMRLATAQYTYNTALNSDLDSAAHAYYLDYLRYTEQYWTAEEAFAAGRISRSEYEDALNRWRAAEARLNETLDSAEMEQLDAGNQVDQARNNVFQAQERLQLLQSGPTTDTIRQAELEMDQALLAAENARADLEAADLRAPFGGTVVEVTALPGEYVGTAPIITLADLEDPLLCFWVEESDMSGVVVGNRVEIFFEALPDETFAGEVIRVDPALVTVDRTLAVQAWASLDLASHPVDLLGGMNAEVEVISAESRDALIVPVQALRELGSDQYAVFVVQPDGEMMLRPVEVGLMDFANAEILSGLEAGEAVSLGIVESTETNAPSEERMMPGGPGAGGPGTRMLEGR